MLLKLIVNGTQGSDLFQCQIKYACDPLLCYLFVLFDLILNVPSTIFQLYRDGSSWVEPVLS